MKLKYSLQVNNLGQRGSVDKSLGLNHKNLQCYKDNAIEGLVSKLGIFSHLCFAVRGTPVRWTSVLSNVILVIMFAALHGVLGW